MSLNPNVQSCETCRFFRSVLGGGSCRIAPPVPVPIASHTGGMGVAGIWPAVTAKDWCGKWEPIGLVN